MPPTKIMKYAPPQLALKFRPIIRFFPNCALLYVFSKDFKIKKTMKIHFKFSKKFKSGQKNTNKIHLQIFKKFKISRKNTMKTDL